MMQTRKSILMLALLSVFLILTACGDDEEQSESVSQAASPSASAASTASPEATPSPSESAVSASPSPATTAEARPDTQPFEWLTTDGYTPHEGKLQQGDGFSLYVFDGFAFDAAAGRLSLTSDPDYSAVIEPLPAGYAIDSIRAQGNEELAKFGEIKEHSGELVEHPLGFAELYLQASSGEGIRDYIVWKSKTGESFLFRIANPKGEPAQLFGQPVMISLSTVEGNGVTFLF